MHRRADVRPMVATFRSFPVRVLLAVALVTLVFVAGLAEGGFGGAATVAAWTGLAVAVQVYVGWRLLLFAARADHAAYGRHARPVRRHAAVAA